MAMKPVKPKAKSVGLKKDGTSLPSKMNEMKRLEAKVTGNTRNKYGLPDNIGEQKAMNKLSKMGVSMGIGDYADVSRYLSSADKNAKKAKAKLIAKRVSGTRSSDKMYNPKKSTTKKSRGSNTATQVGNDNQREGYNAVRDTKIAKTKGENRYSKITTEQAKKYAPGYKRVNQRTGGRGK
jgi:hypothetical protein